MPASSDRFIEKVRGRDARGVVMLGDEMIDEVSHKMAQTHRDQGPRRRPAVLNDDPVVASAAQARNKPSNPNKWNKRKYGGGPVTIRL